MRLLVALCICGIFAAWARADVPTAQDAMKEIGVALGWRLRAGTVEEHCRSADPAGAEARKAALQGWQEKNSRQIQAVDAHVDAVVPLLGRAASANEMGAAIRGHIRQMLLEQIFENKSADETAEICRQLVDPANLIWTNNGMPFVPESLAALYDWKIARSAE